MQKHWATCNINKVNYTQGSAQITFSLCTVLRMISPTKKRPTVMTFAWAVIWTKIQNKSK